MYERRNIVIETRAGQSLNWDVGGTKESLDKMLDDLRVVLQRDIHAHDARIARYTITGYTTSALDVEEYPPRQYHVELAEEPQVETWQQWIKRVLKG